MTIKTWTQRLRDNREANLSMDALDPPTVHETHLAMYEEITELRAELEKAHMHIKCIGNDALRSENAALRAELEKIKAQEPECYVAVVEEGYPVMLDAPDFRHVKLYLAPGAQPVPEGMVLVPIEPTNEMIVALMRTGLRHAEYKRGCSPTLAHMAQGYTAMLEAAKP